MIFVGLMGEWDDLYTRFTFAWGQNLVDLDVLSISVYIYINICHIHSGIMDSPLPFRAKFALGVVNMLIF